MNPYIVTAATTLAFIIGSLIGGAGGPVIFNEIVLCAMILLNFKIWNVK